jgi:transcriptional regulator with XRE-family HTH domain
MGPSACWSSARPQLYGTFCGWHDANLTGVSSRLDCAERQQSHGHPGSGPRRVNSDALSSSGYRGSIPTTQCEGIDGDKNKPVLGDDGWVRAKMSTPGPPEHRTVVCVDVAGFTARFRTTEQLAVRGGMYRALRIAFDGAGAPWEDCEVEDRGDGAVILVAPTVPKSVLAGRLPNLLATALAQHNIEHDQSAQIRLRMAIHAGEIQFDDHGVIGNALNLAFRLLEAGPLKRALAESGGPLAVITSQWFYNEVIAPSVESASADYRRVRISVKETRATAWICLPDGPYATQQDTPRSTARRIAPTSAIRTFPAAGTAAGTGWPTGTAQAGPTSPGPGPPPQPDQHSFPGQWPAGPAPARKVLGARLRRLRRERDLTRADAASVIGASESKIQRIEAGHVSCKPHDIAALLNFYGITDVAIRSDSLALAHETGRRGWTHTYRDILSGRARECLELEQATILIRGHEPHVIPRLLQTPAYARAMLRHNPDVPHSRIERWAGLLTTCQQILHPPEPTELWMVLDEHALRGGPHVDAATMRHQLHHLIELNAQPHIKIQILQTGTPVATGGAFTILRFRTPELRHVVYLEHLTNAAYRDDSRSIEHYQQVMHRLICQAAEPQETTPILHTMLETI